jgi:hypothetical protein
MPQYADHVVIERIEDTLMPVQKSQECREHDGSGETYERRCEQSYPKRETGMPCQQVTASAEPRQENGKAVDVQQMIEEASGTDLSMRTSVRRMSVPSVSTMAAMNSVAVPMHCVPMHAKRAREQGRHAPQKADGET